MDLALVVAIQILYAVASLVIISSGLAVIFGMMKVINLAHGEFLMLGAYATIGAIKVGINLWIAIFLVAPVAVGHDGWHGTSATPGGRGLQRGYHSDR